MRVSQAPGLWLLTGGLAAWLMATPVTAGMFRLARPGQATSQKAKPRPQAPAEKPQTKFVQVAPAHPEAKDFARSPGQSRAVVLIHGYWLVFNKNRVAKAVFKDWQHKDSLLVTTLAKDSDVFAFAYGQTVSVHDVAHLKALEDGIASLKKLGYRRIVLVGHSAGGVVAREFVEDHPASGVTKVVQVCAPNGGCAYAETSLVPKCHRCFVGSLSRAEREKCLRERAAKRIPPGVQFVCVVDAEDFIVPCKCQWTKDLQDQGVPAIRLALGHRFVMRKRFGVQRLAELIRDPKPRWTAKQVAQALRDIFKTGKPKTSTRR